MGSVIVFFLGIITISILVSISKRWEMHEKVDKGISFCYWKLSYRRKFIRTLWLIPIGIFVIFCFYIKFQSAIWTFLVAVAFAIMLLVQAIYNYKQWKKEEIAECEVIRTNPVKNKKQDMEF